MSTSKLKIFWENHDQKILTILAIVLVAIVSFQAGRAQQQEIKEPEIKVSLNQSGIGNPAEEKVKILGETAQRKGTEGANSLNEEKTKQLLTGPDQAECALVGSKNSDKYHLPNCPNAAKIKPGNRTCFSSVEEAESKGYKPAGCCH